MIVRKKLKQLILLALMLISVSLESLCQDITQIQLTKDSAHINMFEMITCEKAISECIDSRKIIASQDEELYYRGVQIAFWKKATTTCFSANDTLTNVIVPRFLEIINNRSEVLKKANKEIKHYKTETLGLKITTPIVAVLSAVGGFLLGHYLH
jgi:hypothetical protein